MKPWVMVFLMTIFLLGAGIYLLWYNLHSNQTNFLFSFFSAQPASILFMLVVMWRSSSLSNGKVSYRCSLKANALVYLGMWLTPMRLSEFIKPFYFQRSGNLPSHLCWALVVKERIWDLFGFSCFCIFVLFFTVDNYIKGDLIYRIIILCVITFGLMLGLFMLSQLRNRLPLLRKFKDFSDALVGAQPREHIAQAITGCFLWFLSAMQMYVFYNLFGLPELSLIDVMFVFLASTLGLVITVTPAGLGTYEASLVAVLSIYDINIHDSLAFAFGFRLCWMLFPSLLGVWVAMQEGFEVLSFHKESQ